MKQIDLSKLPPFENVNIKDVLKQVSEQSPQRVLTLDEMRRRIHIMDAIDKLDDGGMLTLEDADHKVLVDAVSTFPWNRAHRSLVAMIDAITNAETVAVELKPIRRQDPS